jgi:hypothetical protein
MRLPPNLFVLVSFLIASWSCPPALAAPDVVLGGLATAGPDCRVALGQLRESLVASFRVKDANGDGRITLDEFLKNAQETFEDMEQRNPGAVSRQEMLDYRCGKTDPSPPLPPVPGPARSGEGFYRHMDLNGDGSVSPAECRAVWSKEFDRMDHGSRQAVTLAQYLAYCRDWFARMDVNNDGYVTLAEYLADQMGAAFCPPPDAHGQ